jgi:cytochrome c-type biogenesis protein CcmE
MRLRKQQRLALVILAVLLVGGAAGLVLAALQDKVAFFVTPTQVAEQDLEAGRHFRLGGLVVAGSIKRDQDGTVRFAITDTAREVTVAYKGLLPDLFRDGQGVVTQGVLRPDGVFEASEVLAKHDENYMPKEVADALKEAGYWNQDQGKPGTSP